MSHVLKAFHGKRTLGGFAYFLFTDLVHFCVFGQSWLFSRSGSPFLQSGNPSLFEVFFMFSPSLLPLPGENAFLNVITRQSSFPSMHHKDGLIPWMF